MRWQSESNQSGRKPLRPSHSDATEAFDHSPKPPRRSSLEKHQDEELEDQTLPQKDDSIPKLPRRRYSTGSVCSSSRDSITFQQSFATVSTDGSSLTESHTEKFTTLLLNKLNKGKEPQNDNDSCRSTDKMDDSSPSEIVLPLDSEWMLQKYDVATTVDEVHDAEAEVKRLQIVRSYNIANGNPDPELDNIACSAQALLQVPIACVSVIGDTCLWLKSIQGMGEIDIKTIPRNVAFCSHTLYRKLECGLLVIPDCSKDFRLRDNPFVTGPLNLRFYASLPLMCPETGAALGTMSVIDTSPRPEGLNEEQKRIMRDLADRAIVRIYQYKR